MLTVKINKQLTHYLLDVEFTVSDEIVVLFGPSGSGKTTILNCIAGITTPDEGFIRYEDELLFEHKTVNVPIQKRQIGYLFQDYALFPHMTVWKNIYYGTKNETFAKQLMTDLRIAHLKNEYPQNISGGEKQRVALARALATEPKILLLDEPFSALDESTRVRAQQELVNIYEQWNIPIIIITHDYTEAKRLANRVLYIHEGRLTKGKPF
ncbi:MAG TPA: ATP-binding cassette domain-containing protein [Bacillota bacterium]|nr:ATP-binding cassette domain-containing protein [Bacillota bacterium]